MTEKLLKALQESPGIVKNINGADYVPIGEQEKTLDSIYQRWDTSEFKFKAQPIGGRILIRSQIRLQVWDGDCQTTRIGAISFWVTGDETGIDADYAGIAKSYALNNACKSLGKVFGRELNNRVEYTEFSDKKSESSAPTKTSTEYFKNKIKL